MKYSDLLMWQYKLPKATAEIDLTTGSLVQFMQQCLDFAGSWDIDTAEGYNLDVLGRIFGVSRASISMTKKDYLTYYEKTDGLGWGRGRWYVAGEALREAILLNDFELRFLIRAKIWKLYQNPSIDYITDALQDLTGSDAFVVDLNNMTMRVAYGSGIQDNSFIKFSVENLDILPRPVGVKYLYESAYIQYFGFGDAEFDNNFGFDVGQFLDA